MDFTIAMERERLAKAIKKLRAGLGQHHVLVINNHRIKTREWLPSLNPADQAEVVGYAAQADVKEADQALAAAQSSPAQVGSGSAGRSCRFAGKARRLSCAATKQSSARWKSWKRAKTGARLTPM